MKNNYNQIIKERLDNRKEWLAYYIWLLTHRELHEKAKRAYYKERPIQNLIIKFYFLPLNFIRYFSNLFDRCRILYFTNHSFAIHFICNSFHLQFIWRDYPNQ